MGNFIINFALRTGTRAAQRKQTPVDGHCLSLNFIHKAVACKTLSTRYHRASAGINVTVK